MKPLNPKVFALPAVSAALALAVLAYQWLAAIVFVGATRYRVPWDFLLAIPAAAAVVALSDRLKPSVRPAR